MMLPCVAVPSMGSIHDVVYHSARRGSSKGRQCAHQELQCDGALCIDGCSNVVNPCSSVPHICGWSFGPVSGSKETIIATRPFCLTLQPSWPNLFGRMVQSFYVALLSFKVWKSTSFTCMPWQHPELQLRDHALNLLLALSVA